MDSPLMHEYWVPSLNMKKIAWKPAILHTILRTILRNISLLIKFENTSLMFDFY